MVIQYRLLTAVMVLMAVSCCFADTFGTGTSYPFTLEFVTVNDAGNAASNSGVGAVSYSYRIMKTEMTADQWVAPDRILGNPVPFQGYYPVISRTLVEMAEYCNWLHNGATSDPNTLLTGVYNISNGHVVPWDDANQWVNSDGTKNKWRHKNAKYFLPTRDEWYKAGFYKCGSLNAGYWSYATQSNTIPTAENASTGTNSANYGNMIGASVPVGSYPNSISAYGTLDQCGNVWEAVEPLSDATDDYSYPGWGGCYLHTSQWLNASLDFQSAVRYNDVGVRIAASIPTGGKYWVRNNPFTIMSAVKEMPNFTYENFRAARYLGANLSTLLPWQFSSPVLLVNANASSNMPWHQLALVQSGGLTDQMKLDAESYTTLAPGRKGFYVNDEPSRLDMENIAAAMAWYRQVFPGCLVYTNMIPYGQLDERYYGQTPPSGGYNYNQYLNDAIAIIKPDVLMYDNYPFRVNGATDNIFPNMAIIRQKALDAGIPYWVWIQSYSDGSYYRTPSESDLRMQVYSHLAYGYTGVAYFTYNNIIGTAMVANDDQQTPTQVYTDAANINAEVATLGKTLRYLTSTGVGYVPGTHYEAWDIFKWFPISNTIPEGVGLWSSNTGGNSNITSIEVVGTGDANNGLIGFFTDDNGRRYFMLTNLKHGSNMTASAGAVEFKIHFAQTINQISRINSLNGEVEALTLTNHMLDLTLGGGTGSLFMFDVANTVAHISGDANCDGVVDVGDLGILAANYGKTSGATWSEGDFNGDGAVDVGDLGILAANYGTGSSSTLSWADAYTEVFGTTAADTNNADSSNDSSDGTTNEDTDGFLCSSLGLPLITGLLILGLMIVKL